MQTAFQEDSRHLSVHVLVRGWKAQTDAEAVVVLQAHQAQVQAHSLSVQAQSLQVRPLLICYNNFAARPCVLMRLLLS